LRPARGIISGNSYNGVAIGGVGQLGTLVVGNQIGGDLSGDSRLGNNIGLHITEGAQYNFVGGLGYGDGNSIIANQTGVENQAAGIDYNWVAGNTITGSTNEGVYIHYYASHNFIARVKSHKVVYLNLTKSLEKSYHIPVKRMQKQDGYDEPKRTNNHTGRASNYRRVDADGTKQP
jgi:hypothetical protein